MSTSAKATIRLKTLSKKQMATILEALKPEAKTTMRRAKVRLEKDGLFLVLTVVAEDTVALRSTLNAYLRWINSAINIIELIKQS